MNQTSRGSSFIRFTFAFLLFVLTSAVSHAEVILSEIMYNPVSPENANEYIELYNTGPDPMPLNGWTISDGSGTDELIPHSGTNMTLDAGHYAVILDPDYWDQSDRVYLGRIPVGTLMLTVGDAALCSGGLGNSTAETVTLANPSGIVTSQRTYLLGAQDGCSEERIDLAGGEGDGNWSFSSEGGTPGEPNSVMMVDRDLAIDSLSVDTVSVIGHRFLAHLRVTNVGRLSMDGSVLVSFSVHTGSEKARTTLYRSHNLDSLATGESVWLTDTLSAPWGGAWHFRAYLWPPDERQGNDEAEWDHQQPYTPGSVRIAEVMASPPDSIDVEWVELVNLDSLVFDTISPPGIPFEGWSLRDRQGVVGRFEADGYTGFPYYNEGNRRGLWAQDAAVEQWNLPDDTPVALPTHWPSLNDGGDSLYLVDPLGIVIDRVEYGASTPGLSLVRDVLTRDAGVDDWSASMNPRGATPGQEEVPVVHGLNFAVTAIDSLQRWETGDGSGGVMHSFVVTIQRSGSGALPDSLPVRFVADLRGIDHWAEQDHIYKVAVPSDRETFELLVPDVTLFPGPWGIDATLQTVDDDLTDNEMTVDFFLSYTGYNPYDHLVARVDEVMAWPDQGYGEWFEMDLRGLAPVDVAGWVIEDAAGNRATVAHDPETRYFSGFAVFAEDSAALSQWPGIDPAVIVPCSTWAALNNDGDGLTVYDQTGAELAACQFGESEQGHSLIAFSNEHFPWGWANDPEGNPGTPGEENPQVDVHMAYSGEPTVTVAPNPFSPDGDGHEDEAVFTFSLPNEMGNVTLRLFDSRGREVGTLLDDEVVWNDQGWAWDGRSGLIRSTLPAGLYAWVATVRANNSTWQVKGALATTGTR